MKGKVVLMAIVMAALGCAERPFVRADPPVSSDGVTVALVGQKWREAWYENYDVLDLDMVVQVTNGTAFSVAVILAEMRFIGPRKFSDPAFLEAKMAGLAVDARAQLDRQCPRTFPTMG